jgi:anti-anti-sigma factor
MEVQRTELKRCDLIEVSGRLDSANALKLEETLKEVMDHGRYRIVLDLSGVDFMGSAALRVVISAYKNCRRWNRGDVRLAALPPRVQGVFDLAGITPLVKIYPEVYEAVGSF